MDAEVNNSVLDGTDLILSVDGKALGFSTGCKISTTVETGERITKEAKGGKFKDKYVKSISEEITADGMTLTDGGEEKPTYDDLKAMQLQGKPIDAQYSVRDGDKRTGKEASGYKGKYLITSLELDGPAGDDSKYSVKLENSGPIIKVGNGLSTVAAAN